MDKPFTAEDIASEYGDEFLRELTAELQATAKPTLSLDWAEPGDGPLTRLAPAGEPPRNLHLRANPLPRKKWPSRLAPWQEELLVLWWRTDLSESALGALVEAHRPMVVAMAQKYVGTNRKLLIEYGMFGLRLAATRQWASGRKRGALAGYDASKGYRFSTYARHQAERMMREAARGHRYEPPQHLQDTKTEFEEWATTPIPIETERERANRPNEYQEPDELGYRVTNWGEFERRWYIHEPVLPEAKKRTGRPTSAEQNNRKEYFKSYGYKFATFDRVAQDGMSGWDANDEGSASMDLEEPVWTPCSGAFQRDQYKLPKDVMVWRWKLAKARYGTALPYAANDGIGLYDKFGGRLPLFDLRAGKVKRSRANTPAICLRPAAGIYLVGAEEVPMSWRRGQPRTLIRNGTARSCRIKCAAFHLRLNRKTERGYHHVQRTDVP
jgi:hypothetical protein